MGISLAPWRRMFQLIFFWQVIKQAPSNKPIRLDEFTAAQLIRYLINYLKQTGHN